MTEHSIEKTKQSVDLPFRVEMVVNRIYNQVIDAVRPDSEVSFEVRSLSNEDFIHMLVQGNRELPSPQFGSIIFTRLQRYFRDLDFGRDHRLTKEEAEQAANEVIRIENSRISEA